jgi:glyoxylase-like metal-dependent hydrolase (beta-lactamase superfamily II)/ferredoxin
MAVAPFKKRRTQNVAGNLFVDESCIDCDVCRWMCPSTFSRKGIKAAVYSQPETDEEKIQAYTAMISCPVGSIRTFIPDPLVKQASMLFPAEIDPVRLPGVMHLGFHAPSSFGATPYLIRRSAEMGGSVMIDTPRYNSRLADAIEEECGGIDTLILTHKDDVADHQKWKDRFPKMERIIHRTDVTKDTQNCEVLLEGLGSWQPFSDLLIQHTPGHTAGSLCVQYHSHDGEQGSPTRTQGEVVLFTGDHISFSGYKRALDGFKSFNHGNVLAQLESIELLATDEFPFLWILPAHGRMVRFKSIEEKNEQVMACARSFETEDESVGMFSMGYR